MKEEGLFRSQKIETISENGYPQKYFFAEDPKRNSNKLVVKQKEIVSSHWSLCLWYIKFFQETKQTIENT